MKKLSLQQMSAVEGGQVSGVFWQGDPSLGSRITVSAGTIGSLHYSWLDCASFFGSIFAMGIAVAGTGGLAMLGGVLALGSMAASAGNCEGYLNG